MNKTSFKGGKDHHNYQGKGVGRDASTVLTVRVPKEIADQIPRPRQTWLLEAIMAKLEQESDRNP